jgi:glutathione S-transferase
MMTTVIRGLQNLNLLGGHERLAAYIERCTSRPAFKRALDAQLADFSTAAAA